MHNRYLIVSDLHLCDVEEHDDGWKTYKSARYLIDEEFAALLDRFVQGAGASAEPCLVLNGDVFDFDMVTAAPHDADWPVSASELKRGLDPTRGKSAWKFRRILDDPPVFVRAPDAEPRLESEARRHGLPRTTIDALCGLQRPPITRRFFRIVREFWIDRLLLATVLGLAGTARGPPAAGRGFDGGRDFRLPPGRFGGARPAGSPEVPTATRRSTSRSHWRPAHRQPLDALVGRSEHEPMSAKHGVYDTGGYRKHKRPEGWGSLCPDEVDQSEAQRLLDTGVLVDDDVYNVEADFAFRAQQHEPGRWHGHPIPWSRLPSRARDELIKAGRLDAATWRRAVRKAWGREFR